MNDYTPPTPRESRVRAIRLRTLAVTLRIRARTSIWRGDAMREQARKLEAAARIADSMANRQALERDSDGLP